MTKIIFLFLLLNMILNGCVIFQPLKRVKEVDSTNKTVLKYAENYKYLGKVLVNFPNDLNENQKKYVFYNLEPYMAYYGYKRQPLTTSYKDYQLDIDSYKEHINRNVRISSQTYIQNNLYFDLFSKKKEKIYSHIFYICRESQGLVANDFFVCMIEINGQIKLIYFSDLGRSQLRSNIKTSLFLVPFLECSKFIIDKNTEEFLEEYLRIELNAQNDPSTKANHYYRFTDLYRKLVRQY